MVQTPKRSNKKKRSLDHRLDVQGHDRYWNELETLDVVSPPAEADTKSSGGNELVTVKLGKVSRVVKLLETNGDMAKILVPGERADGFDNLFTSPEKPAVFGIDSQILSVLSPDARGRSLLLSLPHPLGVPSHCTLRSLS